MIEVHLDLSEARQNLVAVRLRLTPVQTRCLISLPAWTPGSYMIRDHVRHLEGLELHQAGVPQPLRRLAAAQWSADLLDLEPLELRYRIQAHEQSVRTCHVNGDHAFLALVAVVLQVEGHRWSPHRLRLTLPEGWRPFLPLEGDPEAGWLATDFDQLVDSPLEAGPHREHGFDVAGVPHRWVTWGDDLPGLDPQWLGDVYQICLSCCRLLNQPAPAASRYLFILHLLEEGYGGLEHDDASVLVYGRRALSRPEGRRRLLQLVAHEYLHQWNVRRLRPAELVPLDYDRPTPVAGLWFAEGITSYLDQLIPHAAGLCSEAEVLEDLGSDISRYRLTPGRAVQSLRDSAQEAWVKLYRQDALSRNNQISYYLKGAIVALVLDLHLRRHGSALTVVLQDLWSRFGRCRRGYQEQDLVHAFAGHAPDLSTLLPNWLTSTDDPCIDAYLDDVGVRLVAEESREWFVGWQVRQTPSCGRLEVTTVDRGSPAAMAGLQPGDELLAINGWRLRSTEDVGERLTTIQPSDRDLCLLFCRDGRIRSCDLAVREPAIRSWRLELVPGGDCSVEDRRRRWLRLVP